MPRPPRPRGSLRYDKPPMALDGLVGRLAERGLAIADTDRAARYLRHIGYYRLSPYTIPFQQGRPDHLVRKGAAFDDVRRFALVPGRIALPGPGQARASSADRPGHLRRAAPRIAGRRGGLTGPPLGPRALPHDLQLPRAAAIVAHGGDPDHRTAGQRVPQPGPAVRQDRGRIEHRPDSSGSGVLDADLRPGAEHLRTPREALERRPRRVPRDPELTCDLVAEGHGSLPERSRRRLYPVLVSLQSVLDSVSPRSSWARRLHELLSTRPPGNLAGMGVPGGWADDGFWSRHIR